MMRRLKPRAHGCGAVIDPNHYRDTIQTLGNAAETEDPS